MNHLHILHLFSNTAGPNNQYCMDEKLNAASKYRHEKLMEELDEQNITDYTIFPGTYDKDNTKQAIHIGHRLIVQLAKDKNLPYVIIAEDDVRFTCSKSYEYFLSQIPKSFDLFFGLIYVGDLKDNRVMNSFSGGCTLFVVHNRFYDFFINLPVNTHIDRELGAHAHKHEYYVCQPYVVTQRGGYSYNLRQSMFYDVYLEGKDLYGITTPSLL